jgi:hypothetical protein
VITRRSLVVDPPLLRELEQPCFEARSLESFRRRSPFVVPVDGNNLMLVAGVRRALGWLGMLPGSDSPPVGLA